MSQSVKPFLRALAGETQCPPPIWLMRQAGRYLPEYRAIRKDAKNFLEFCYTPDLAVEVTLQPLRRYGFDAAILFSDILVIADALGQGVAFKEGEGPVLEPIRDAEGLANLNPNRVLEHLAPVFETVRRLIRDIPPTTALIGFAGAPWTVATYMVEGHGGTDYAETKRWAWTAPREFQRLIDILIDATAAYLIEQVRNGAEALQIFDSWAGVLSESEFLRWVIAPTKTLVARIKQACPSVPIIGFPRGAGAMYETYMAETGIDAVSLDSTVPLGWAARMLQSRGAVQGNLDNQLLRQGGAALDEETDRILRAFGQGPFVFNLGHGILLDTPPEHVARLVERVRAFTG